MNILFYTPFNDRSRDTESLMQAFVNQGHSVYLLTQAEHGHYHEACAKIGVYASAHVVKSNPLFFFLNHTFFLIRFCKKNKIQVVYAHLETAALPAVMAQYFIYAKVFVCRHVIDEPYLFNNRNFILLVKLVYRLARNVIVVSTRCKEFMVNVEKIQAAKIQVIRLAYNFNFYNIPDFEKSKEIRKLYPAKLLLLSACRLVKPKRADYAIEVAHALTEKGLDVKLLILGKGPELQNLEEIVSKKELNAYVFLLGHRTNIIDYIQACDIFVHPSMLDSSSVVIKEAGLLEKPVIACRSVGDVEEYLQDGVNGFLVSKENCIPEMIEKIEAVYHDTHRIDGMGKNLKKIILNRFSIETNLPFYNLIHEHIQTVR
ncbi:MAG: glycosyltransferase [Bacteroidetes bacterium]|nr:glycosyltransferase [Bacteroidota bacterium]MBS1540529.1 glycosyltransferase [Bacteroidota bacterium]